MVVLLQLLVVLVVVLAVQLMAVVKFSQLDYAVYARILVMIVVISI